MRGMEGCVCGIWVERPGGDPPGTVALWWLSFESDESDDESDGMYFGDGQFEWCVFGIVGDDGDVFFV